MSVLDLVGGREGLTPDCNSLQKTAMHLCCAEGNSTVTPPLSRSVVGSERSHRRCGPGGDSSLRRKLFIYKYNWDGFTKEVGS